MSNLKKIIIGIRDSKLSKAQSQIFIKEARKIENIKNNYEFELKEIKTTGDIHNTHRLDQIGGKGLFVKEIEQQIISEEIDLGIHSMKDVPAVEVSKQLEISCWMTRYDSHDALISNSGQYIADLPPGAIIGTSSIRRRSQVLGLRKDLKIKLLRGNVDTRIKKLHNKEYDAIILSLAGLQRLGLKSMATEVLNFKNFLPAAGQGAVGIQTKRNSPISNLFKQLNDERTQIECMAERIILNSIKANCNSPVSVLAKIREEQIKIDFEIMNHAGEILFKKSIDGDKTNFRKLSNSLAKEIKSTLSQQTINELDVLKDDFNYTP